MPRGPNGEWRPADTIGCAVMVAKIATSEIEDDGRTWQPPHQTKRRSPATPADPPPGDADDQPAPQD